MKPTCRHCRLNKVMQGHRGLCHGCHKNRAVRALYPSRSRASHNPGGLGLGNAEPPPCPVPTDVLPGPARVAVLAARAEAGVGLWHEHDNNGGD